MYLSVNDLSAAPFEPGVTPPDPLVGAAACWFLFRGDQLLVQDVQAGHFPLPLLPDCQRLGISPVRQHYLGFLDGGPSARIPCYVAELAEDAAVPPGYRLDGLRQLYELLGERLFMLAGRAIQVLEWDRTHQFCGRCGTAMAPVPGERAKRCPSCGLTHFPRLSPAIIIAVTRPGPQGEEILLARNHRFPPGRYSVIAGFVEPGETLEECARREVREEVGIEIREIRYFGSQPWPFPNSLMIGFTATYAGGQIRLEDSEIAQADWFTADNLPQLPPKMSIARRLIDAFVARQATGVAGQNR
ncbi:MAG: NADH pyrophosphatase [Litorilinea sp.]|nr:MAG: NADH pyrophosphatase [Litorilinea sp.]